MSNPIFWKKKEIYFKILSTMFLPYMLVVLLIAFILTIPTAYEVCNGGIYSFCSFLCVCLSVCQSVNIYFVSKISQELLYLET